MGLIRAARNHRGCTVLAAVLGLLLLGGGAAGWLWLTGYWTDPDDVVDRRAGPCVMVTTYYPGMPASSIEKTITNRIERWVTQAPGVEQTSSRSTAGVSMVLVEFRRDTDPQQALTVTSQLALGTLQTLPPNTLPPVVLPFSNAPAFRCFGYAVAGNPTMDEANLTELARTKIRNKLGIVPGLVAPVVQGGKERTIWIHLDMTKLDARRLSIQDVIESLKMANLMASPGHVEFRDHQIMLEVAMSVESVEDLNSLPIHSKSSKGVFLRDIGHAVDSYARQTLVVRVNGHRTVCVPLYRQYDSPPLRAAAMRAATVRAWPEIEGAMPAGTKLDFLWLKSGRGGRSRLTIYVRAPSNSSLAATEKHVAAVEKFLEANIPTEDRAFILSQIGTTPDSPLYAIPNDGPFDAIIRVQLVDEAGPSSQEYAVKLRHLFKEDPEFADLRASFVAGNERPIDIRIQGGKPEQDLKLAREVRKRVSAVAGAADVHLVQRRDAPFLVIEVDRQKAAAVGLKPGEVILQAMAALNPISGVGFDQNFWIDAKVGNQYFVACKHPERPGIKLEDFLNIEATGTNSPSPVKLSGLASIRRDFAPVEIDHASLVRAMDVHVNVEDRSRNAVVRDIEAALKGLEIPAGVTIDVLPEAPLWP